jgi:putative SOS response-associated peptidase YedK
MPVMLMPEDYDRWLDPAMGVEQLRAMLKPYHPNLMTAYEVSRAVNRVKNDTLECVEPLAPRR